MSAVNRGPWVTTRSGKPFYLADPRPEDFDISDMAAGISKDCRFGGQLSPEYDDQLYVVAQHCVYVDRLVGIMGHPEARKWAIMHDAPEGIYGDMTSPLKKIVPQYCEWEDKAQEAMIERYKIPYNKEIAEVVHVADKMLGAMEARVLSPVSHAMWEVDHEPIMSLHELDPDFHCWSPLKARQEFLQAVHNHFGAEMYNETEVTGRTPVAS